MAALAEHTTVNDHQRLVVWLDDLHLYLPPSGDLTLSTLDRFTSRPGQTVVLATLRTEQRDTLRKEAGGELT
ncbi:hypothetical protein SB767_29080, partial [Bacillus sp. SIMBA_069]